MHELTFDSGAAIRIEFSRDCPKILFGNTKVTKNKAVRENLIINIFYTS